MKPSFRLEIQHENLNLTTQTLEKGIKEFLKKQGFILSHYRIESFYLPSTQWVYLHLTSLKTQDTQTLDMSVQTLLHD